MKHTQKKEKNPCFMHYVLSKSRTSFSILKYPKGGHNKNQEAFVNAREMQF